MPVQEPLHAARRGDSRAFAVCGDGEKRGVLPGRGLVLVLLISAATCGPALAQQPGSRISLPGLSLGAADVIQLAMFAGVMLAAMLSAVWLIRERARIAADNLELRGKIAELTDGLQRSEALLNLKDQRLVVWSRESPRPELIGSLPLDCGAPDDRAAFLAFGRWLTPRSAGALETAIAAMREEGRPFERVIETRSGALLEVQGRYAATHSVARFVSLTEARRTLARLRYDSEQLQAEHDLLRRLIESLDTPFWRRDADGRLIWVNPAYANAVEAPTADRAVGEQREFLGGQARELIQASRLRGTCFRQAVSTVVAGERRIFAVTDVAAGNGSAGLAIDRSEVEALREEYARTVRSHADTLDKLTTAVAIFDEGQKLRFHNHAFQELWDLDPAYLATAPENALLLDRLRSEGKLPEMPEWRRWKDGVLSAYRTVDPREHSWHLPDGRTIRVVANPNPKGGVTFVFENLTERIDLESRYNTAVRVQRETLDNLAEGVTVFGPDGRLRLANPAFSALCGLDPALAREGVHIADIRGASEAAGAAGPWGGFVAAVTGFDEERRDAIGQTETAGGRTLRFGLIHLPNGHVMITFVDVTDSVKVERALTEKNEALRKADQLKNDFVQHVSYELRSPLTNIIGFTELLEMPETGPLNERQRDYVDHIGVSSSVLLTIVNDILDLATVDAGIMELDLGDVAVGEIVEQAAARVADRLREHAITLDVDLARAPTHFEADAGRIRQILFNLLTNAANYAPEGSTVRLRCMEEDGEVVFSVADSGPGMPAEVLDTVFRRFETHGRGGRKRGAGLGLAIVKSFVELHGGSVEIATGAGAGTTVTCRFPAKPQRMLAAE